MSGFSWDRVTGFIKAGRCAPKPGQKEQQTRGNSSKGDSGLLVSLKKDYRGKKSGKSAAGERGTSDCDFQKKRGGGGPPGVPIKVGGEKINFRGRTQQQIKPEGSYREIRTISQYIGGGVGLRTLRGGKKKKKLTFLFEIPLNRKGGGRRKRGMGEGGGGI